MTATAQETAPADPARFLPILLLLFAGSGCAALIYEIVWFQLLSLAIGSTAYSLGILLATFMGGLSLGSWLLPRLFAPGGKRDMHPLKLYALIELGIGLFGLLELLLIPLIDKLYVAGGGGMLLRSLFCAIALLPPTILMGASLPAIARWAQSTPRGVSWWGLLYGINIAGAVTGALVAGFYLLRVHDVYVATFVAALVNLAAAGLSWLMAARVPAQAGPSAGDEGVAPVEDPGVLGRWSVLIAIALSGAVSMGAQVIWTRLLGLMLGATVYVFSIILAVFLIGLGIGAAAGSALARRGNARSLLGWSQLLAALGIFWTAWQTSASQPLWPIDPLVTTPPFVIFQLDFIRVLWSILPATLLWGAAVPLAFAGAVKAGQDPGRTVGGVYAANTLGAIAGALLASLVLVPVFGSHAAQIVILIASVLAALIAFAPLLQGGNLRTPAFAGLILALLFGPLMAVNLSPPSPQLVAYGRRTGSAAFDGNYQVLRWVEGVNSSIAYTQWADGSVQFHVAGKVEATNNPYDMRLERMLGYLPILFHENPQSVLVVGFGAGVTAGCFTTYPTLDRIQIVELEPAIPPNSTDFFGPQNHFVMRDPRTKITYDDARHYMPIGEERFDIVTSDPIHPFVKGSASLYSKEYFEMLRRRLKPGGIVTQWIPLYESDMATVKSEIATFFEVFPHATVWANNQEGYGYDVVLIGHEQPLTVDIQKIRARLATPAYAAMAADLEEVGFLGPDGLLDTYAGDKVSLEPWLRGAVINTDRSLRLQYMAGLSLNRDVRNDVYQEILGLRAPSNSFVLLNQAP